MAADMSSMLCDTCQLQIDGRATYHWQLFGRLFANEEGVIRFPHRPSGTEAFICASCHGWLQLALHQLRAGYVAAREAGVEGRPLD